MATGSPPPLVRPGGGGFPRFTHVGLRGSPFTDTYHWLLGLRWSAFLALLAVVFVVFNAAFASLYLLGGDCYGATDPTSFLEAFSFSVQTMASVGYGAMSPATPYAHVVSIVETFCGLLAMALSTGLMFAKASRGWGSRSSRWCPR